MAAIPVDPNPGGTESIQGGRLFSASRKLSFWTRFTAALLSLCFLEAMILVAGGVFELVQVAPHLERYQEIFPDEDPTRMARSMIAVGGLSLLVFGIPLVLVMRTAVFMTRFIRTSELPHLVGFARWFRRSLVVLVLWLVFYLVFLLGYAFYVNTGGPS